MRPDLVVDLPLHLPDDPRPLPVRICEEVRGLIMDGVLAPGDHLPSTRVLSAQLRVSRGTVVASYEQLEAEGYLRPPPAQGPRSIPTCVAFTVALPPRHRSPDLNAIGESTSPLESRTPLDWRTRHGARLGIEVASTRPVSPTRWAHRTCATKLPNICVRCAAYWPIRVRSSSLEAPEQGWQSSSRCCVMGPAA